MNAFGSWRRAGLHLLLGSGRSPVEVYVPRLLDRASAREEVARVRAKHCVSRRDVEALLRFARSLSRAGGLS